MSIRFYQKFISLDQGIFFRKLGLKVCRFEPYCSEYTYQAIDKYGLIKGSLLGTWRILRCNPFSKGGYDPVKHYGLKPVASCSATLRDLLRKANFIHRLMPRGFKF